MITLAEIEEARERLGGVIRPTPSTHSAALSLLVSRPVVVKPEYLQRTGSFKIRGAYNRIAVFGEAGEEGEVVAASAGNHAQGVALAASLCGMPSTIFMPFGASLPKVEATRSYGAAVRFAGETVDDAIAAARHYAGDRGVRYIPPFDDPMVIAGQGTVGLEIATEVSDPEVVLVPVGGGGLIAGVAAALRAERPSARVVGVEASGAASMRAALERGTPVCLDAVDTLADGVAVRCVSELTLEHAAALVDEMVTVDDEEISEAVLMLLERCKAVVEPAGAVGLAALLAGKVPGTGTAVVVLSGGNVDPLLLTRLIEHGLSAAGRYFIIRVVLSDRPGSLGSLTSEIGKLGLNLVTVDHRRFGAPIGVNQVEVFLTVETRGPHHRDEIVPALQGSGFHAEAWT